MDSRFYSCRKCGVIVGLVEGSLAGVTCDGEPLEMMRANSVDASREKHVPVVSVAESIVSVKIGSAEHPMTAAHHISWIYLQTQKGGQRRALTIDDKHPKDSLLKLWAGTMVGFLVLFALSYQVLFIITVLL